MEHQYSGTAEAPNSSNRMTREDELPNLVQRDSKEQSIMLLPRSKFRAEAFWIGVLAKHFDIWNPSYPVKLREKDPNYTFDFFCEEEGKLVKILGPDERETIAYLDLPYADSIIFIIEGRNQACGECGDSRECSECQRDEILAKKLRAYVCTREGRGIGRIEKWNAKGDCEELFPGEY